MNNWLLSLSGVDRALLARTPRETAKFVGVGGAVLMTAVMAGLSAGYALYVSLDAPLIAVLILGALWGVGILNLDRWIIAATKRQGAFFKDVGMVLPRLLLAIIIGAVISEPLVLRIFNSEIESELRKMKTEQQADFERGLIAYPRYSNLADDRAEVASLQQGLAEGVRADAAVTDEQVMSIRGDLDRVNEALTAAEQAVACEGLGACGSGNAGAGPVFRANEARRDRLLKEKERLELALQSATARAVTQAGTTYESTVASKTARLEELQATVADTQAARDAEMAEHTMRVNEADGLLNRIEALHRLTEDSEAMSQARWALFLFILAIECLPVLVKLFMNLAKPTAYEQLQDAEDKADHDRALLLLSADAEEASMQKQVALDAAEVKARAELDAHLAASRALLDAQIEVVKAAAAVWRTDQLDLLKASPDLFFGALPQAVDVAQQDPSDDDYFGSFPVQHPVAAGHLEPGLTRAGTYASAPGATRIANEAGHVDVAGREQPKRSGWAHAVLAEDARPVSKDFP